MELLKYINNYKHKMMCGSTSRQKRGCDNIDIKACCITCNKRDDCYFECAGSQTERHYRNIDEPCDKGVVL